jgi:hypothetical protein
MLTHKITNEAMRFITRFLFGNAGLLSLKGDVAHGYVPPVPFSIHSFEPRGYIYCAAAMWLDHETCRNETILETNVILSVLQNENIFAKKLIP